MGLLKSIKKRYKRIFKGEPRVYDYSLSLQKADALQAISLFEHKPLISIITPVYNVEKVWLEKLFTSVTAQYYPHWELCIADDCSNSQSTIEALEKLAQHANVKLKFLKQNVNISQASNEALKLAEGEYIALLDHDDELTPDALFEIVKAINETGAEFIYSDEDKLDFDGNFCEPHFKPDFSLDFLLSTNYVCHLTAIKKSLVDSVGGFEVGLEGSQDHDLFLKCIERTSKIFHIPKVLYHWRMIPGSTAARPDSKSYAQEAGRKAIRNYLLRNNIEASVSDGPVLGIYQIKRKIIGQPLVTIIIPFKDKPELLEKCLSSIIQKSDYKNYEILGVNNNSTLSSIQAIIETYEKDYPNIRFLHYTSDFNYSKINNFAAQHAKGEYLLLLNNDIEIINSDWIERLLEHAQREEIGAVGAKLFYPDGRIQHAGVGMGIGGMADHWFKFCGSNDHGYFGRLVCIQNLMVVTGACLMVKTKVFNQVGGLEEQLAVDFNDVDFCLRLYRQGYQNVFTPHCQAYHHESVSRGKNTTPEAILRSEREANLIRERYSDIFQKGDPYYNPNLSLSSKNFELSRKHLTKKQKIWNF